jgi:hypothetical protein
MIRKLFLCIINILCSGVFSKQGFEFTYAREYHFKRISYKDGVRKIHAWDANPYFNIKKAEPPFRLGNFTCLKIHMDTMKSSSVYLFSDQETSSNLISLDTEMQTEFLLTLDVIPAFPLGHRLKLSVQCNGCIPLISMLLNNCFDVMCTLEDSKFTMYRRMTRCNEYVLQYKAMVLKK